LNEQEQRRKEGKPYLSLRRNGEPVALLFNLDLVSCDTWQISLYFKAIFGRPSVDGKGTCVKSTEQKKIGEFTKEVA
jgi:hypothetical protein